MTENWRELAAELTQDRLWQDMHDLDNDMAGRDTGRIKRFVTTRRPPVPLRPGA